MLGKNSCEFKFYIVGLIMFSLIFKTQTKPGADLKYLNKKIFYIKH